MKILFEGPFTEDDLRILGLALRECESKNPTANFLMVMLETSDDPQHRSLLETAEMLQRVFPQEEGAPPDTFVMPLEKKKHTPMKSEINDNLMF
jgi:hypothetical protein